MGIKSDFEFDVEGLEIEHFKADIGWKVIYACDPNDSYSEDILFWQIVTNKSVCKKMFFPEVSLIPITISGSVAEATLWSVQNPSGRVFDTFQDKEFESISIWLGFLARFGKFDTKTQK